MSRIIDERKLLLADRLAATARLAQRLNWSRGRVGFPLNGAALKSMDETSAESVSAFLERFAKLQDLLGATFREVASLSGQPAEDYNLVLGNMEKVGIANADEWRELRALRNDVAHEYSLDFDRQARLFNALAESADLLLATAQRLAQYCAERLKVASPASP
jgi:hypothetical protein